MDDTKTEQAITPRRNKGGRPSVYTDEIADEVLDRLAGGESLNGICKSEHLPHERTIRGWCIDDREGFAARYWRARTIQALEFSDELVRIADEEPPLGPDGRRDAAWVNHQRTRVETRRWVVSRLLPKTFGDRVEVGGAGSVNVVIVTGVPPVPGEGSRTQLSHHEAEALVE